MSDGFTPIPNTVAEKLMKSKFTNAESNIIMAVARQTYGWSRDWAKLSYADFMNYCDLSKRAVRETVTKLQEKGVLRVRAGAHRTAAEYGINGRICEWSGCARERTVRAGAHTPVRAGAHTEGSAPYRLKKDIKETPYNPPRPTKRKHPLPEGYELSDKHRAYAQEKYSKANLPLPDLDDVFEAFTLYHRKHGNQYADWYATWQTWVRNQIEFTKRDKAKETKAVHPMYREVKTFEDTLWDLEK